eukprot:gene5375-10745_t
MLRVTLIGAFTIAVLELHTQDVYDGKRVDVGLPSGMASMYGRVHTNDQGNGQYNIAEVEAKMQASAVGSWTSLGPTYIPYPFLDSGRARSILPHPTIRDTLYVLSAGGGLWKITNFFVKNPTWVPLTDKLVTTSGGSASLGSNPETIYLGLGDPFLRPGLGGYFTKSTDGGSTWTTPLNLNTIGSFTSRVKMVYTIVVDTSTGSDIILMSTDAGLFRSSDGGLTFTNPYLKPVGGVNPQISTLARTDFGGRTNWGTVVGSDAGRTTFAVGASGESTIYAQVANRSDKRQLGIFKSTDGGVTWTSCKCNANYAPTPLIPGLQTNLDITDDQ